MNPEDVGRVLDEIGERIGPAGEYAWTITVKQVYVEGWLYGAVGLLALLVAVFSIGGMLWHMGDGNDDREFFGFGASLLFGISGLVSLFMALASIPKLINPEYHAMVRLLERLVPQ